MIAAPLFMLNGNMLCAVNRDRVMFRVGKDQNDVALKRGATPMEMRGRVMSGFVWVKREQLSEARELKKCIEMARGYVRRCQRREWR